MARLRTRSWLAVRVLLVGSVLPLGAACNALWGIDAPTLVPGDGGGHDGPLADVVPADGRGPDGRSDAPPGDAAEGGPRDANGDATPEGAADSPMTDAPPVFDGHCSCAAVPCPPVVLASGLASPQLVVTDTNGVYFTTDGTAAPSSGTVGAFTFADGKAKTLASKQGNPSGIAVASGNLAWAAVSAGTIELCPLPGCATIEPVTATDVPGLGGLAFNASDVFFESINAIDSCPTSGCTSAPTKQSPLGGPGGIAIDATDLYWADQTAGTISTCPLAGCGGSPFVVTSGEVGVAALVLSAGSLFWTDDAGEIRTCDASACDLTKESLVGSGTYTPVHLAVDAASVYFTAASGLIVKVGLIGGAIVELETAESVPSGIAVGTSCVFWASDVASPDGEIRATAK